MSRQRTLEQKRAAVAWDFIQSIKKKTDDDVKKKYGSLAQKAPADIQTGGLGQTLAFWRAKSVSKEDGKDSAEKIAHREILRHVTGWLNDEASMQLGQDNLVEWVSKEAGTNDYRRATTETIAFLVWLKRFAEAELP